jgi:hypothetical protein
MNKGKVVSAANAVAVALMVLPLAMLALDQVPAAQTATNSASTNSASGPDAVNSLDGQTMDYLWLRNGDRLNGKLAGIDPQSVRWKIADAAQPIEFKPETVAEIDFPDYAARLPATKAEFSCKLQLADGSLLRGSLVSCDLESLLLDTWYGGRLTVARNAIQKLSVTTSATTAFDGITSKEGWTEGSAATAAFAGDSGVWTYRNGAFYADKPASIARDLRLPDVADMEFDLTWKGALNLAIALYTDSLQPILLSNKENGPDFGGFYSLRIQSVFMQLMRIKKKEPLGQSSLGDLVVPSLSQTNRVHVNLRCSKPGHFVALFIDGALIKQWVDAAGFAGEGTGVRFVQNPPGGAVKISNLLVSRWDGVLEENKNADIDSAHDTAWLSDGVVLSGTVKSIGGGKMSFQTSKEQVDTPLEKLRAVEFAQPRASGASGAMALRVAPAGGGMGSNQWQPLQAGAKPALGSLANTRASFAQGGVANFQLENWSADGIAVSSTAFGKAKFNPSAFVRFQFLDALTDSKAAPGAAQ